ncbi:7 transmembrane sweet-taste receptor of 3 GCPR [Popillia japonica]
MAIYNEFLLSVFLNVSMLFLQKPANPDLLYIIFFCHTQLTVTLLLCLIFGSKAYMVFKGHDRTDENSGMMSKSQASKFLGKARSGNSQYTSTNSSMGGLEYSKFTEQDVQEEFLRLYTQLEMLKEKNMRVGNRHLASKISAMQDAASRHDNEQAESSIRKSSKPNNTIGAISEKFTPNNETLHEEDENAIVPVKTKKQNVSFAQTATISSGDTTSIKDQDYSNEESAGEPSSSADASIELSSREDRADNPNNRNGRLLKSGHARTHAIVINLDDKSRFTEEVTV